MLHPQPTFADDLLRYLKDRLASPDQQQSAICINRDMALTTNDLFTSVITTDPSMRSLDALTVVPPPDGMGWDGLRPAASRSSTRQIL